MRIKCFTSNKCKKTNFSVAPTNVETKKGASHVRVGCGGHSLKVARDLFLLSCEVVDATTITTTVRICRGGGYGQSGGKGEGGRLASRLDTREGLTSIGWERRWVLPLFNRGYPKWHTPNGGWTLGGDEEGPTLTTT